jgi:hypothetical protein
MDCNSDIIYQDEYVCILNPKSKRGVEVMHAIGFLDPIGEIPHKIMNIIKKNGLKSSGQLLLEKGVSKLPTITNNNTNLNQNAMNRQSYLKYNTKHFSRIFLRPPCSAPYTLKNGELVSAGNWKDFLGTEREHRLFFGGQSYSDSMALGQGGSSTSVIEGIVTLRVDPEKTYIFYEAMKSVYNRNRFTGMPSPSSWKTYPKSEERFLKSATKLSDHLDKLQSNPGSVDKDWEIMVTAPNIPSCAFEKIIFKGDTKYDTEELPEDIMIKKKETNNFRKFKEKGEDLAGEVYGFLIDFNEIDNEIGKLSYAVIKECKKKKPDNNMIEATIKSIEENIKIFSKLLPERQSIFKNFLPIQKEAVKEKLEQLKKRLIYQSTSAKVASKTCGISKPTNTAKKTKLGGKYKNKIYRRNITQKK